MVIGSLGQESLGRQLDQVKKCHLHARTTEARTVQEWSNEYSKT